jgi:hypothetical protein
VAAKLFAIVTCYAVDFPAQGAYQIDEGVSCVPACLSLVLAIEASPVARSLTLTMAPHCFAPMSDRTPGLQSACAFPRCRGVLRCRGVRYTIAPLFALAVGLSLPASLAEFSLDIAAFFALTVNVVVEFLHTWHFGMSFVFLDERRFVLGRVGFLTFLLAGW